MVNQSFPQFQSFPQNQSFPIAPIQTSNGIIPAGDPQQLLAQAMLRPQDIAQSSIPIAGLPKAPQLQQAPQQGQGGLAQALSEPQKQVAPQVGASGELSFLGALAAQDDIKATGTSGAGDFLAGLLGGLQKGERAKQSKKEQAKKDKQDQAILDRAIKKDVLGNKKIEAEIKKLEKEAAGVGGFDPEKKAKIESGLRKEFTTLSKDFFKQRDAHGRVLASAKDPSAAGDLALIFNYMKVLDPGSTVREGEFATAQNSGSVGSRITAQYNKLLEGKRLSPLQRTDFVDRAGRLFESANSFQDQRVKRFGSLAERTGVSPENVAIDLGEAEQESVEEQVAPETVELKKLSDEELEAEIQKLQVE